MSEMTVEEFIKDWDYLMQEKKKYDDIINDYMRNHDINIVFENGIVIIADNYVILNSFNAYYIHLYKNNIKIAVARLSLIKHMF